MTEPRHRLEVEPRIPASLARLADLAENLLYSWDRSVRGLFYRIDPAGWERSAHNPKVFLRQVTQARLDALAADPAFLAQYADVLRRFDAYRAAAGVDRSWLPAGLVPGRDLVAYFCMEYGLHESLKIYSGGLGVLAGDHCKAASDLGLPFVAVGLMYRLGYFQQHIDARGTQETIHTPTELGDLPVRPALDAAGHELRVVVTLDGRAVALRVWRAEVGNIPLLLLDSDVPENAIGDRRITYQLYGGDREVRLLQELVLGIGGVRALRALGLAPTVWHVNEGHPAFMLLERCREAVAGGLPFAAAFEQVAAATVFTTHTPVAAGHDLFPAELVARHARRLVEALGIGIDELVALGASPQGGGDLNMTALALRGSRHHNGVSRIHGGVASRMESYVWPEVSPEDNPIFSITNGVHVPTFLAREWANLFDARHPDWRSHLHDAGFWEKVLAGIPDHRFWSLRQSLKGEMLERVRAIMLRQYRRNRIGRSRTERMRRALAPDNTGTLFLGFARRFATYKRALLLFHDPPRLARLLADPARPIVLLFAGKAHPHDGAGQELIRRINEFAAKPEFEGRLFFIEDYDLALARLLVTGVDLWLNTPQHPLEASGTSGQKAAINGVLNLSVLDGWWGEGYDGENGWAISPFGIDDDPSRRDAAEAGELYDILEREVVPTYFERGTQGFAPGWVRRSKAAMRSVMPRFSAHHMVMEYAERMYAPAATAAAALDGARATELARWKARVRAHWSRVNLRWAAPPPSRAFEGEPVTLRIAATLDGLAPSDLRVEALLAPEDDGAEDLRPQALPLASVGTDGNEAIYELTFRPPMSGRQCFRVHAHPWHADLSHPLELGLRRWL